MTIFLECFFIFFDFFCDKIESMSTVSLTLKAKEIALLTQKLSSYAIPNRHTSAVFTAKAQGQMVTLYQSGKLVIQGNQAEKLAETLGLVTPGPKLSLEQNVPLIGTDEVGNGSYFGGIAVVASFIEPSQHAFLKKLGVGDSKGLTDQKIRQLAPVLKEKIAHRALLLSPQKYNQVVGEGKMHNAVSVKVALHNQAIYLLMKDGAEPKRIVVDAFTTAKNYTKYVKHEQHQVSMPIDLIQKAENQFLAVAVSSIIARNLFLENLEQLGQNLHLTLPSGAGQASDMVASQIIKQYGIETLSHLAKLHFANTKKALKRLE